MPHTNTTSHQAQATISTLIATPRVPQPHAQRHTATTSHHYSSLPAHVHSHQVQPTYCELAALRAMSLSMRLVT